MPIELLWRFYGDFELVLATVEGWLTFDLEDSRKAR